MSNILVVLIFIFLKMLHGKKIAGILHHSLAFLLLTCVGPRCVVLFFSCKQSGEEGLGIRTVTHFEFSFCTPLHFYLHCAGRAHRAVELLPALSSVRATVVVCRRRRRAGAQVKESRK